MRRRFLTAMLCVVLPALIEAPQAMAFDRSKCVKTDTQGGWTVEASVVYAPDDADYAPGERYWGYFIRDDASGIYFNYSAGPFDGGPRFTIDGTEILFPRDRVLDYTPEDDPWIEKLLVVDDMDTGFRWELGGDVKAAEDYVVVSSLRNNTLIGDLFDYLKSAARTVAINAYLRDKDGMIQKVGEVSLETAGLAQVDERIARVIGALRRDESKDACTDDE